jgi:hypothetical protein
VPQIPHPNLNQLQFPTLLLQEFWMPSLHLQILVHPAIRAVFKGYTFTSNLSFGFPSRSPRGIKLTDVVLGLMGTPAYPLRSDHPSQKGQYVAHKIRPQFASIPKRAVLTSADRAIVDAICFASPKLFAS